MTKTTFSQIITKQMMNKEKMVLYGFYKIGILHLEIQVPETKAHQGLQDQEKEEAHLMPYQSGGEYKKRRHDKVEDNLKKILVESSLW